MCMPLLHDQHHCRPVPGQNVFYKGEHSLLHLLNADCTIPAVECFRSGMCFMSGESAAAAPAMPLQQSHPEHSQQTAPFKPPGHPGFRAAHPAGAAAKAAGPLHDPTVPGSLVLNMQQWQCSKVQD